MVDPELRAELRLAVHRLRRTTRQRVFAPTLHVGALFGESITWPLAEIGAIRPTDAEPVDVGLAGEIVAALLSRALLVEDRPAAWLTRVGFPEPHDLDLAWLPVASRVFTEAGIRPRGLVVVTKNGWYEPLGDDRATWARLRVRTPVPSAR
ncbi:hypothetical protein ncot_07325 [Nocardioides sp. JQ2195]|uniref:hypothetical protein n=1 Tax=Nocardioides sp. JQ2195 TaxID=2592334 RepID=UPI00143E2316|nr:hypothetical protein [Nocardioides sp. JQ2195]QIX26433.1 hypothetical protein ncot_07325 [Nocardioides sp. JQ2195]